MRSGAVGYSGTPLPKKLGIREGQRLIFLNAPDIYGASQRQMPT